MKKQRCYATITLIGKDRIGLVARVTHLLFEQGANIEGLEEQVRRGTFSMTLQASWEVSQVDERRVKRELRKFSTESGLELKVHFRKPGAKQRMAIFVTKESHALEGILAAVQEKKIDAEAVLVLGNYKKLKPLATVAGVPFVEVDWKNRAVAEEKVSQVLEKYEVDFIVLARFMKILSPHFVWQWKNRIINIHPSLLPAFPGASAYRQAYEKGVKIVGVTAHFVTPDLDEGPILCQESFKLRADEELRSIVERGQALESVCLVKAVKLYLRKGLDVHWGKVFGV